MLHQEDLDYSFGSQIFITAEKSWKDYLSRDTDISFDGHSYIREVLD